MPGGSGVRTKSRLRWYRASFPELGAASRRLPAAMTGWSACRATTRDLTINAPGKHHVFAKLDISGRTQLAAEVALRRPDTTAS